MVFVTVLAVEEPTLADILKEPSFILTIEDSVLVPVLVGLELTQPAAVSISSTILSFRVPQVWAKPALNFIWSADLRVNTEVALDLKSTTLPVISCLTVKAVAVEDA